MSTKNPEDLEEKAWYRIAKVLYGLGWLLVILLAGITFIITKPNPGVDLSKSTVTCDNGKSFSLSTMQGYYSSQDKFLDEEDNLRIVIACEIKQFSDETLMQMRQQTSSDYEYKTELQKRGLELTKRMAALGAPEYKLNFVEKNLNSEWVNSLLWVLAIFAGSAVLLDLIKKITLYILTGKKFKVE